MKIFSGSANKPLSEKVCQELGIELSENETHVFPDGEKRIRILEYVLDEKVVIIQPTSPPADSNYMELFFLSDAIKRGGAKEITAVISYLGYQRQDHMFREGEAVSLEVVIGALESLGIGKFVTFDLHSIKIPELFKGKIVHLSALPIFAKKIQEKNLNDQNSYLVSPDMGGVRRIKLLSSMLGGLSFATIEKNRDLSSGHIEMEKIEGEVKKKAIIVDDMISSGVTIAKAAKLLREKGTEEVYVFVTHPVFSGSVRENLDIPEIDEIFVTDSIDVPKEKKFAKLKILTIAPLIAEELKK